MKTIGLEIKSNEELWSRIDKKLNHILIHKFTPHEVIEWWQTDIRLNDENFRLEVRNMEFDIQTNLTGLKKILDLNTNQLHIYQFDRPIPGTLSLEYLPENNREAILLQNGLKHVFYCDFEHLSISSVDQDYLETIRLL